METKNSFTEATYHHMVLSFPEEGTVFIGSDPSEMEKGDSEMGYKVLIRTVKALQELNNPEVSAVLKNHHVAYEEPKK